jgi:hypothetical protein
MEGEEGALVGAPFFVRRLCVGHEGCTVLLGKPEVFAYQ